MNNAKQAILIDEINGEIIHKKNFLAEPRYDIKVANLNIAEIKPLNNKIDFKFLGAVLRSAQMIGAMEKVLDLSTNYCSERQQFGRALSKFQAIQHQISDMAVELSASSAALSAITDFNLSDKKSSPCQYFVVESNLLNSFLSVRFEYCFATGDVTVMSFTLNNEKNICDN